MSWEPELIEEYSSSERPNLNAVYRQCPRHAHFKAPWQYEPGTEVWALASRSGYSGDKRTKYDGHVVLKAVVEESFDSCYHIPERSLRIIHKEPWLRVGAEHFNKCLHAERIIGTVEEIDPW